MIVTIELPALELKLPHLLRIPIEYLSQAQPSPFLQFLESNWPAPMTKLFWQAYERLQDYFLGALIYLLVMLYYER